MPKASLSTCHVEFTLVWQCGETWLNLVIIITPAQCVTISTGGTKMFSRDIVAVGVHFVTITPKYTYTVSFYMLW